MLLAALAASGALTLFAGSRGDAWVLDVHDAVSVAIAAVLVLKLRRVWPRLRTRKGSDWRTMVGLIATFLVAGSLASGFLWSDGATLHPASFSLLAWHEGLGAFLVVAVAGHMLLRAKRLRTRDLNHRRQFLTAGGLAIGSFVVWRSQRPFQALFELRATKRRFTGSYEVGSFAGNAFPSTSWVADNPQPIDRRIYRLRVQGLVATELSFTLDQLPITDEVVATLDCTGGFYSTQRWRGAKLGQLIDLAGPEPRARHVSVASKTGYRWSFALEDAAALVLATQVGSEPLSHEHGAPVRLVVPGARGYQWVKWVDRVELLSHPDYGAPASTVWSSFT